MLLWHLKLIILKWLVTTTLFLFVMLVIKSFLLANRLKIVLPNLVKKEQCGYIASRSPLDNILAVQEVEHSIEQDYKYHYDDP